MTTATQSSTPLMQRLETRLVNPEELLPEETILARDYFGHRIADYPEPARAYNVAFGRLEPVFKRQGTHVPLLVYLHGELLGIMNFVWTTQVGVVPVKRSGTQVLVVPQERTVTYKEVLELQFGITEILTTMPSWCRKN